MDTSPLTSVPIRRATPFDPPPELTRLRPLVRLVYPDGHLGWLATSHAAARVVLGDPRFSVRLDLRHPPVRLNQSGSGTTPAPGMFAHMDPPESTRYRRLLAGRFTARRVKALEPRITRITNDHLDAMAAAGDQADLVESYALPIPSLVICELLGVPYGERAFFQKTSQVIVGIETSPEESTAAMRDLAGFLASLITHLRGKPGDDLLSSLTETDLTDAELATVAMLLLVAGHETTANMIALGVLALLEHPDQLAALRADPGLIDGAVEELLRYLTILHYGAPYRAALEDVELEGELIRAGETVTVSLPAADRDPAQFPAPDELRIERPDARRNLAFGYGTHLCLGHHLARAELRIAYPALFDRFPGLRLAVPAGEIRFREQAFVYGVESLPVAWS